MFLVRRPENAGVIDEDVDRTEGLSRVRKERAQSIFVGDVDRDAVSIAPY